MLTRRHVVGGVIASMSTGTGSAQAGISPALVDDFLRQGQWSEIADDDATPEVLSQDLLRRLVKEYRDHPNEQSGQSALGLFALALAVAEWGVRDPNGLPPDPVDKESAKIKKNWASDSGPGSGKHLMSYSVGGIGISHADGGEFVEFVRRISQIPELTEQQRVQLLAAIDKSRYKEGKVTFDQLRAASVCRPGAVIRGKDQRARPVPPTPRPLSVLPFRCVPIAPQRRNPAGRTE